MTAAGEVLGFRPAEPADAGAISELALALWWAYYVPDVLTEAEIEFFWRRSYLPGMLLDEMAGGAVYEWIEAGGERVGFLSYRGEPGGVRLRLGKLYVVPDRHGQGIGAAALARVKAAAAALGYREIGLYVFRRNEKAIRAYRRAGFVVERAELFDAGDGFFYDDYVMVCRLGEDGGEGRGAFGETSPSEG